MPFHLVHQGWWSNIVAAQWTPPWHTSGSTHLVELARPWSHSPWLFVSKTLRIANTKPLEENAEFLWSRATKWNVAAGKGLKHNRGIQYTPALAPASQAIILSRRAGSGCLCRLPVPSECKYSFFLGCDANRNWMCMRDPASKQAQVAFILTVHSLWPWLDGMDTGSGDIAVPAHCQCQHNCLGDCAETKKWTHLILCD